MLATQQLEQALIGDRIRPGLERPPAAQAEVALVVPMPRT